ncbi:hypothetical protein [Kibdelosporangium phytohabitans]|uniref:hypothetical protein n=1 Tax=Kibdelosporangium phytohabitans TaxID=860235 RepID=UPI0012FB115B|nr:hypothetical protein [Kibdelosporangium phytohabitans]MBE1471577.1 hypothetical protein [Kibdelosporangium phytohabitans]
MSLLILEMHLMIDMISGVPNTEDAEDAEDPKLAADGLDGLDEQLINQLVSRAKAGGPQFDR